LRDSPVRIAVVASLAVGALTLAVADLALTDPMSDEVWLPPLAVSTTSGTLVVYVLRDDGDSRTVLQDAPRQVLVLPDADVEDERLCAPGGALDGRSLWDITKAAVAAESQLAPADEAPAPARWSDPVPHGPAHGLGAEHRA
jgi:hypothetical protein